MHDGLDQIRGALAAMSEQELAALKHMAEQNPPPLLDLFDYLAQACDWELARRSGQSLQLDGPHAAIEPSDVEDRLLALVALEANFRSAPNVAALFRGVAAALSGDVPPIHRAASVWNDWLARCLFGLRNGGCLKSCDP